MSRQILESLNPLARKQLSASGPGDAVTDQLAAALRNRGTYRGMTLASRRTASSYSSAPRWLNDSRSSPRPSSPA